MRCVPWGEGWEAKSVTESMLCGNIFYWTSSLFFPVAINFWFLHSPYSDVLYLEYTIDRISSVFRAAVIFLLPVPHSYFSATRHFWQALKSGSSCFPDNRFSNFGSVLFVAQRFKNLVLLASAWFLHFSLLKSFYVHLPFLNTFLSPMNKVQIIFLYQEYFFSCHLLPPLGHVVSDGCIPLHSRSFYFCFSSLIGGLSLQTNQLINKQPTHLSVILHMRKCLC